MAALIIILCVILAAMIAVFPVWAYSISWGYYPFGLLSILFLLNIIVIMSTWSRFRNMV